MPLHRSTLPPLYVSASLPCQYQPMYPSPSLPGDLCSSLNLDLSASVPLDIPSPPLAFHATLPLYLEFSSASLPITLSASPPLLLYTYLPIYPSPAHLHLYPLPLYLSGYLPTPLPRFLSTFLPLFLCSFLVSFCLHLLLHICICLPVHTATPNKCNTRPPRAQAHCRKVRHAHTAQDTAAPLDDAVLARLLQAGAGRFPAKCAADGKAVFANPYESLQSAGLWWLWVVRLKKNPSNSQIHHRRQVE